jgi:hypothetical protein
VYHARVDSKGAVFINFGDSLGEVAKIKRDKSLADALDTPDDVLINTANILNPDPLIFYGVAEVKSGSAVGNVSKTYPVYPGDDGLSTTDRIELLRHYHGTCVMRIPGEPTMAVTVKNISTNVALEPRMVSVTIPWTKVRADGLAF